ALALAQTSETPAQHARAALLAFVAARQLEDEASAAPAAERVMALSADGASAPWVALGARVLEWTDSDLATYGEVVQRIDELARAAEAPDDDALAELRSASEASGADALRTNALGELGHHLGALGRSDEARAHLEWLGRRAEL